MEDNLIKTGERRLIPLISSVTGISSDKLESQYVSEVNLLRDYRTLNLSNEECEKMEQLVSIIDCVYQRTLGTVDGITLCNSKDVFEFGKGLYSLCEEDEKVFCCYLNNANKLINCELESIGDFCMTLVPVNKIVRKALLYHAGGVILIHNHFCKCLPSKEDLQITERLENALQLISVRLLDHVIMCGNLYYSIKEGTLC